jgi:hypothetical protein
MNRLRNNAMIRRSAGSVARESAIQDGTLATLANVVLEHLHKVGVAVGEAGFLITLPAYLDETELYFLQLEVNRRASNDVKLEHRPGERRVGVRLLLSRLHR